MTVTSPASSREAHAVFAYQAEIAGSAAVRLIPINRRRLNGDGASCGVDPTVVAALGFHAMGFLIAEPLLLGKSQEPAEAPATQHSLPVEVVQLSLETIEESTSCASRRSGEHR
jgi:hypothetical protein